jgi:recombination protein RecA
LLKTIRSGAIDIVVIIDCCRFDSKSEIEGEMGDSKMGLHARLMSGIKKINRND